MIECISTSKKLTKKTNNLIDKKTWKSIIKYSQGRKIDNIDDKKIALKKQYSSSPNSSTLNSSPKMADHKLINFHHNLNKIYQQKQLTEKARRFVTELRQKKKQFQGKIHLLKRAEVNHREEMQIRKQLQIYLQKEAKKRERRIKAEKNIQYYHEKRAETSLSYCSSPKKRTLSVSFEKQKQCKTKFPPINFPTNLEEIKEQGLVYNMPIGLKKCMKNNIQKRLSNTGKISNEQESLTSSQAREIALMKQKQKIHSRRESSKFKIKDQNSCDRKVCYLMKRTSKKLQNYLQKFDNLNQLIQQKLSPKRLAIDEGQIFSFRKVVSLTQPDQVPSSLLYKNSLQQ